MLEQLLETLPALSGGLSLWIIFAILLLCGLGMPFSEEIPLLVAGYLAYRGEFSLSAGITVCFLGVMIGDLMIFGFGNRLGLQIFRFRWFKKILNRKRLRASRRYFARYGNKVVFFARFIAGIRAPIFITAAILRMRFWTFFWIDLAGALLSVPVSVWLAWYFGAEIEWLVEEMRQAKEMVLIALILGVLVGLLYWMNRRRRTGSKVGSTRVTHPTESPEHSRLKDANG